MPFDQVAYLDRAERKREALPFAVKNEADAIAALDLARDRFEELDLGSGKVSPAVLSKVRDTLFIAEEVAKRATRLRRSAELSLPNVDTTIAQCLEPALSSLAASYGASLHVLPTLPDEPPSDEPIVLGIVQQSPSRRTGDGLCTRRAKGSSDPGLILAQWRSSLHQPIRVADVLTALSRHEISVFESGHVRAENRLLSEGEVLTTINLDILHCLPPRPFIARVADPIQFTVGQLASLKQHVLTSSPFDAGHPVAHIAVGIEDVQETVGEDGNRTVEFVAVVRGFNALAQIGDLQQSMTRWASSLVSKTVPFCGRVARASVAGQGTVIGDKQIGRGFMIPIRFTAVSQLP